MPQEALQPGGVITCASNSCNRLFHNTWILHAFESSIWDAHDIRYFELTKTYGFDEKLGTLIRELRSSPTVSPKAAEILDSCRKTFDDENAIPVTIY